MTSIRSTAAFVSAMLLSNACFSVSTPLTAIAVEVDASDVDRFFEVYDEAAGHPSAEQLQAGYIDRGSIALKTFVERRQLTGQGISEAIAQHPEFFANARSCAARIPAVRARLQSSLTRLAQLYPDASFPPTSFLVGRGRTGGTTSRAGVLIGIETLCSVSVLEPDLEDRLVHLVAHEYAHVQQPDAEQDDGKASVLHASLLEGGAEFLAELISSSASYVHLQTWTRGREREIEQAFFRDKGKIDKSKWLWSGLGTPEAPGDLGYWVGYRIVKSYYNNASDKPQALHDILMMKDPQAFLENSGWSPGITLP